MNISGDILISTTPYASIVAILDSSGVPIKLRAELKGKESKVGDIWVGKVSRPVPGHKASFVSLGKGNEGILAGNIRPGKPLLVQIVRDSFGGKGPKLTTLPNYAGRYLVFSPHIEKDMVSRGISDISIVKDLLNLLGKLNRPVGGFIARRLAARASKEELISEAKALILRSEISNQKVNNFIHPSIVESAGGLIGNVLRELASVGNSIWFDNYKSYEEALNQAKECAPVLIPNMQMDSNDGIFSFFDMQTQYRKSLDSIVLLPSGGKITIEENIACVSIDVDAGINKKTKAKEIACKEAIIQSTVEIVRRNLAGLIIIDLPLDSGRKGTKDLIKMAKNELKKDKISAAVLGVTHGGLLEITRRRIGPSLLNSLTEPDLERPWVGRRWRLETIAHEVCLQAKKELQGPSTELTIRVNKDVAQFLTINNFISSWLNAHVFIESQQSFDRDQFEVEGK